MTRSVFFILLLSVLSVTSCRRGNVSGRMAQVGGYENVSAVQTMKAAPMDAAVAKSMPVAPSAKESVQTSQKLIKNGEISFETSNSKETKQLIISEVKDLNGYISNDNIFDYQEKVEHRLVIRIPAESFDVLLAHISDKAGKILSKNISVTDVTEEFVDIEARIKTKKELESRYRDLMKQANKVDDMLAIEREMGTLRSDIESIEGRLKYLSDQVSVSTLTVTFYEKSVQAYGFGSKFGPALSDGWNNLLGFILAGVSVWPFLLFGLLLIGAFLYWKKRKSKK